MVDRPLPTLVLDPEAGFISGTLVHTREGLKAIESIRPGDQVLTHPDLAPPPRRRRERSEYLYRRVTRTTWVEVGSLVHITLCNLADGTEETLQVAPGQPIWIQPKGWLAAGDVRAMQPLILSFNGNALVRRVQFSDHPARVYRLEVEDHNCYYVAQLGTWVGCNPDAVVQADPAPAAKLPFDFSKSQELLSIPDYYNDTLADPEPPKAPAIGLGEQMRTTAEKLRSLFKAQLKQDLRYDESGVRWLAEYIDRVRLRPSGDQWQGAIELIGAFLGECTIRSLGGHWAQTEGTFCVVLERGDVVFPHNKVAQQFRNGMEGGDSILGFYQGNMALHVAKPGGGSGGAHYVTPVQPQPEMEQIIHKLRTNFTQRQQWMNALTLPSLAGPRPPWLRETDGLTEFFAQQELLLTKGSIVWGALVQANNLLFQPGEDDCPALLVHSPDGYFDARPQELRLIGRTFFSFKQTEQTDPELKEVARLVTDELDRSMGFELPNVFSSKTVRSATFMVFRKHVPNGVLSAGLFPVLAHPSTQAVMMVPFEFWPIELIVLWKENRL